MLKTKYTRKYWLDESNEMLIKSLIILLLSHKDTVITVSKEAHMKGKPQVTTGSYTEPKSKRTSQNMVLPQSNTKYTKVLLVDP